MSESEENPHESLANCIAFSSKDWSLHKGDAWIYGIVIGWEESLASIARKHGWSDPTVDRLVRLRTRFQRQRSPEGL
jgi:hypothetical protein